MAATLTALEDRLRDANVQADITHLTQARKRLEGAMKNPTSPDKYKELALLLEAVIQAEDIINVIYFRYHNAAITVS